MRSVWWMGVFVASMNGCAEPEEALPVAESALTTEGAKIKEIAVGLRQQFDPFAVGFALDVRSLRGATDIDLLRSFVSQLHPTTNYTFATGASSFEVGTSKAAFFSDQAVARRAVLAALDEEFGFLEEAPSHPEFPDENAPSIVFMRGQVGALMNHLAHTSAAVAFDGGALNGCGRPTKYLVIVDRTSKVGYAVDLSACRP